MFYTIYFNTLDDGIICKGIDGCVKIINTYIETNGISSNLITKDVVSNITCRNYYPAKWKFLKIEKRIGLLSELEMDRTPTRKSSQILEDKTKKI
jgi:hypothetical protein